MKGGYTTLFTMQMAQNLLGKYKALRSIPCELWISESRFDGGV